MCVARGPSGSDFTNVVGLAFTYDLPAIIHRNNFISTVTNAFILAAFTASPAARSIRRSNLSTSMPTTETAAVFNLSRTTIPGGTSGNRFLIVASKVTF